MKIILIWEPSLLEVHLLANEKFIMDIPRTPCHVTCYVTWEVMWKKEEQDVTLDWQALFLMGLKFCSGLKLKVMPLWRKTWQTICKTRCCVQGQKGMTLSLSVSIEVYREKIISMSGWGSNTMMEPYLSYPSLDLAWSRAYQIHKIENNQKFSQIHQY